MEEDKTGKKDENGMYSQPDKIYHPQADSLHYHVAKEALEAARTKTDNFQRAQAVVTAMVFSALCLEAFINRAYEEHSETRRILEGDDRIPLLTKWLLLPLLLGAKETFKKGEEPFQTFNELVRVRNQRLVHFKLKREAHSRPQMESLKEPYFEELVVDFRRAEKYVECIKNMISELSKITSGKISLPEFLSGSKYLGQCYDHLKTDSRAKK